METTWVTARWDGQTLTVRVGATESYGASGRSATALREVTDPALLAPVRDALAAALEGQGRQARRAARLAAAHAMVAAAAAGEEPDEEGWT
jgi:hypothetical protein